MDNIVHDIYLLRLSAMSSYLRSFYHPRDLFLSARVLFFFFFLWPGAVGGSVKEGI
jgi:hypothetical protein